jgi:hypothetical protein
VATTTSSNQARFDCASVHREDAGTLAELGEAVLADPAALGLEEEHLISIVRSWVERLRDYERDPPVTDAEWDTYQAFVREVMGYVHGFAGR